jgi:hypothetical protein
MAKQPTIPIVCASCNQVINIDPDLIDQPLACSLCGAVVVVAAYKPLAAELAKRLDARRKAKETENARKAEEDRIRNEQTRIARERQAIAYQDENARLLAEAAQSKALQDRQKAEVENKKVQAGSLRTRQFDRRGGNVNSVASLLASIFGIFAWIFLLCGVALVVGGVGYLVSNNAVVGLPLLMYGLWSIAVAFPLGLSWVLIHMLRKSMVALVDIQYTVRKASGQPDPPID